MSQPLEPNQLITETATKIVDKLFGDRDKNLFFNERVTSTVAQLQSLEQAVRAEERSRALVLLGFFDETPRERQGAELHISQLTKFIARLKDNDQKAP